MNIEELLKVQRGLTKDQGLPFATKVLDEIEQRTEALNKDEQIQELQQFEDEVRAARDALDLTNNNVEYQALWTKLLIVQGTRELLQGRTS